MRRERYGPSGVAIHCDDLGLLYLCTDKTGSTSVSDVLLDQLGGRWLPPDHIWDGDRIAVDSKHSSLADLVSHGLLDEETVRSLHVAITIRNPYAWVLSNYRYRLKVLEQRDRVTDQPGHWMLAEDRIADVERARHGFDHFVETECELRGGRITGRFVEGYEDHPSLTHLRIEHIDSELNELTMHLGVGWRIAIPRVNTTDGPAYRDVYSDAAREMVADAFADDLHRFGYDF